MSTRSQIKIGDNPVLLYKHCDGYRSNVLPLLGQFLKSFMKGRGWDEEYMAAHLMHFLISASNKKIEEYHNEFHSSTREKKPSYLGYGLDCNVHGDIEYFYHIVRDNEVGCIIDVYYSDKDLQQINSNASNLLGMIPGDAYTIQEAIDYSEDLKGNPISPKKAERIID
jgi:hypothetical protein